MVGRVSDTTFTFEYSLHTHRVRGGYLPVTLTVGDRMAHLILRIVSRRPQMGVFNFSTRLLACGRRVLAEE
jgi:hypothetical protein